MLLVLKKQTLRGRKDTTDKLIFTFCLKTSPQKHAVISRFWMKPTGWQNIKIYCRILLINFNTSFDQKNKLFSS